MSCRLLLLVSKELLSVNHLFILFNNNYTYLSLLLLLVRPSGPSAARGRAAWAVRRHRSGSGFSDRFCTSTRFCSFAGDMRGSSQAAAPGMSSTCSAAGCSTDAHHGPKISRNPGFAFSSPKMKVRRPPRPGYRR